LSNLENFESRFHEKLENFEEESAMVSDHVSLFFSTGFDSTQCDCQSWLEASCNDLVTQKVIDSF